VVLLIFAYHHIPDKKKLELLKKIFLLMETECILVVAEIYFDKKANGIIYYNELFDALPVEKQVPALRQFLEQTAQSKEFEFKVPKQFADSQFESVGFKRIFEEKIWPAGKGNVAEGTFVQVYTK